LILEKMKEFEPRPARGPASSIKNRQSSFINLQWVLRLERGSIHAACTGGGAG
jgi:hypothetical protein